MPNSTVWLPRHSALLSLLNALSTATTPVYVVGGVVRDHLMGLDKSANDMDVVVEHSALQVARQVDEILNDGPQAYLSGISRQCTQIHSALYQSYVSYPADMALPA